jgi:transcriptional regulator with XRE-family HTH domain
MNDQVLTSAHPPALLQELGQGIRAHRKALRLSAEMAADSAGLSRLTWLRIERGLSSVNAGAYAKAAEVLGLSLNLGQPPTDRTGWIPAQVRLTDYPQLRQLAWQTRYSEVLSPGDAWNLYERNWRHVDPNALLPQEQQLIDALRLAYGDARRL